MSRVILDSASPTGSLSRRSFVKAAASGLLLPAAWSANTASASEVQIATPGRGPAIPKWPEPNQTRQIWLRRPETGEVVVARYFENGRVVMKDYLAVCTILRDIRGGVIAHIDVELMDLVFAIQSWLVSWGIDKPLDVTSGFRSINTNNNTEGAARNSMHTKGRAIDGRMPGVPSEYFGRLASIFKAGGVGFYTGRNFTHMDVGDVRYWRGR